MRDTDRCAAREAAATGPEMQNTQGEPLDGLSREPLGDLETLLTAVLPGFAAGLPGPAQGSAAVSLAGLGARLGRLEEHFARICTLVGRLEQEVQTLREALDGRGR